MVITERDIKRVEDVFFKGKGSFKDEKGERYQFISCLDKSIDVEACPGSGKTTILLAKLFLLAEKMPLENVKGVCVLTHTNVAIDEIKNRLGVNVDSLFKYPNFFGTIQSFVNKFLAIPYYVSNNMSRPQAIDSEQALARILKTNLFSKKTNDVKVILYKNSNLAQNLTFKRFGEDKPMLVKNIGGDKVELKKPNSTTDWSPTEKEEMYDILFRLKTNVLGKSCMLSFNDAYFYAQEYLHNFPQISDAISKRFPYVFIDEMQDTYVHQDEIIKSIFNDNVIIQRIGDSNQAILNDNESESAWEISECMKISGSRRFSQPIANILKTVALSGDPELQGENGIKIPPYIISYDVGQESKVLEKFVSLIKKHNLDDRTKYEHPFKAVGWVGKEKDSLTLGSYFECYMKENKRSKSSFKNLLSALSFCDSSNPRQIYNTFINSCLEILWISRIKNPLSKKSRFFNKTTLLEYLNQSYANELNILNEKIACWSEFIVTHRIPEIIDSIRSYFKEDFFSKIGFQLNDKSIEFIDSGKRVELVKKKLTYDNTFYSSRSDHKHIYML